MYHRLFVKNLPEKINKTELKRALYMLFSTYGPVLDIVTSRVGAKGQHMRGQAHVVFRDIQTSTQAMRALQGFDLFGKEMVRCGLSYSIRYIELVSQAIVYGKGQSHIIPRLRGTFEPPTATSGVSQEQTALQKSIFNAPPAAAQSKPTENGLKPADSATGNAPQGTKRPRDEEDDDDDDVEMEEDEDDAPMDEDEED